MTAARRPCPTVRALDRAASTAVILLDDVPHVLPVDIAADGTVRPAWWLAGPEVDAALGEHDDLLVEVLTDALTEQLRDEVA